MDNSDTGSERTDAPVRDAPWLRPASLKLVELDTSVVDGDEDPYPRGVSPRPVPLNLATGPLLPRWWLEDWREKNEDQCNRFLSSGLLWHTGPFADFQHYALGRLSRAGVPGGMDTRFVAERRALDPEFQERLVNPENLLDRFVSLAETDDPKTYRDFAERYGVLRICQRHLQPTSYCSRHARGARSAQACSPLWAEPLVLWRFCAEFAVAVLRIAHRLQGGEPEEASDRDWGIVLNEDPETVRNRRERGFEPEGVGWNAREDLARHLNRWLAYGDVRLHVRWLPDDAPVVEDTGRGLFGGLAKRLAYATTGAEARLICHHCQTPIRPTQKPRPGHRVFCGRCRRNKAPQRYAMRDLRERNRRLVEIVEEGLDGPPGDEEEEETFWENVKAVWDREGHPERSVEKLRSDYRKHSG